MMCSKFDAGVHIDQVSRLITNCRQLQLTPVSGKLPGPRQIIGCGTMQCCNFLFDRYLRGKSQSWLQGWGFDPLISSQLIGTQPLRVMKRGVEFPSARCFSKSLPQVRAAQIGDEAGGFSLDLHFERWDARGMLDYRRETAIQSF